MLETAKYWKIRALYYEALYRIRRDNYENDIFITDVIGYPAYSLPAMRVRTNEERPRSIADLHTLLNLPRCKSRGTLQSSPMRKIS